jgi:DNA-directed RNA polymerase subunit RPC12/RpoP
MAQWGCEDCGGVFDYPGDSSPNFCPYCRGRTLVFDAATTSDTAIGARLSTRAVARAVLNPLIVTADDEIAEAGWTQDDRDALEHLSLMKLEED